MSAFEPAHFRIYGDYAGPGPAFYAPSDFPWAEELRRNWTVIREEFEAYAAHNQLRPNFVPDAVEITGWRGVNFFTLLRRYDDNCRHFPRTTALLESIPDLASAFINLLEPRASLPAHYGDSNTVYRAHLGLIVPGEIDECGIQVGAERAGWKEGELLVFNDAHKHFVWNHSDRPRVILVCDVMKREYGGASPRSCAKMFASIAITFVQARIALVRRLPRRLLRALHETVAVPFHVYLALFGMRRPASANGTGT
jgi:hypothetical protein